MIVGMDKVVKKRNTNRLMSFSRETANTLDAAVVAFLEATKIVS